MAADKATTDKLAGRADLRPVMPAPRVHGPDLGEVTVPDTAGTLDPVRPSAKWSLEELGVYARQALRRNAESAWEIGRALKLAKKKAKRKFGDWCQEHIPELNERTRQRYMAVGELDFDDVRAKTLKEAYAMLEGEPGKPTAGPNPEDGGPAAGGESPEGKGGPTGGTGPAAGGGADPGSEGTPGAKDGGADAGADDRAGRLAEALETLGEMLADPVAWADEIGHYRADLDRVANELVALMAAAA